MGDSSKRKKKVEIYETRYFFPFSCPDEIDLVSMVKSISFY
jgi:hypothetical protein